MKLALALVWSCGCWRGTPAASEPTAIPAEPTQRGIGGDVAITAQPTEFSGHYRDVFAQLRTDDNTTVIAFVRGCPTQRCSPSPFEIEQVAHACPNAYVATVQLPGVEPSVQDVDLLITGPASHPFTRTLEGAHVETSAIDNAHVLGILTLDTMDGSVSDGAFTADVCPRT
jgi:hypothetical protein